MSLRTRIAGAAGLAVAIAVIAAAAVVYVAVRANLRDEVERALTARAQPVAERELGRPPDVPGVPGDRFDGGRGGPPPGAEPFGGAAGYVQFVRPDGTVERPPGQTSALPVDARARDIARTGRGRSLADEHVGSTHVLVLTVGAGRAGAVQVARPLTEQDHVLRRVLVVLLLVGAGGIALAVVLGGGVARTALAPVDRFTRRTEEIAGRPDVSHRIDEVGTDELGRLAHSFNTTLDALERAVATQHRLVADASHELRTPIASLRANIQTLDDADRLSHEDVVALRADIVSELDELTALVGDVVELARGARPDDALDDVRLDEIVAAQVERARRRGLDVDLNSEPTLVRGEGDRIGRAVSNLLDNAGKWSPPGGTVEVSLAGGTLTVRDHGPGFEPDDLPHVFERFYRAKAARSLPGSGLGLAIVRDAAEAHGGSAHAANAPGGGALMTVRFGEPLTIEAS